MKTQSINPLKVFDILFLQTFIHTSSFIIACWLLQNLQLLSLSGWRLYTNITFELLLEHCFILDFTHCNHVIFNVFKPSILPVQTIQSYRYMIQIIMSSKTRQYSAAEGCHADSWKRGRYWLYGRCENLHYCFMQCADIFWIKLLLWASLQVCIIELYLTI